MKLLPFTLTLTLTPIIAIAATIPPPPPPPPPPTHHALPFLIPSPTTAYTTSFSATAIFSPGLAMSVLSPASASAMMVAFESIANANTNPDGDANAAPAPTTTAAEVGFEPGVRVTFADGAEATGG